VIWKSRTYPLIWTNQGGKRTFSSLLSKVKAKVQEFDQSRYVLYVNDAPLFNNRSSNDPNTQYPGAYYPANGSSQPDRHTMMQQQSYYDPNVTSQPAETDAGVHGYDMNSSKFSIALVVWQLTIFFPSSTIFVATSDNI
jgi:hypothetical protein